MFDLHAVPCRIAVRSSTCLVNRVCRIFIGTLGEERTRYRKIQQDLPSALSFDIIHNYRYIFMHPRQPTNPPQQPFHRISPETGQGTERIHTKFVILNLCVWCTRACAHVSVCLSGTGITGNIRHRQAAVCAAAHRRNIIQPRRGCDARRGRSQALATRVCGS